MKISQKTIFIILLLMILSCSSQNIFHGKYKNTNYGKFLAASYSVQNGDIAFASSILSNKIDYSKDEKLVELAFFSKIINGEFYKASQLKKNYPYILDKSSFSLIPEITINLRNQNYKTALNLIDISSDLPGFKKLKQKIKYIINVSMNQSKKKIKETLQLIFLVNTFDLKLLSFLSFINANIRTRYNIVKINILD